MSRMILVYAGERETPYSKLNYYAPGRFEGLALENFRAMLQEKYPEAPRTNRDPYLALNIVDALVHNGFRRGDNRPGYTLEELTVLFSNPKVVQTLKSIHEWNVADVLVEVLPEIAARKGMTGALELLDRVKKYQEMPSYMLQNIAFTVDDTLKYDEKDRVGVKADILDFLLSDRIRTLMERFAAKGDDGRFAALSGLAMSRYCGGDKAVDMLISKIGECRTTKRAGTVAIWFGRHVLENELTAEQMQSDLDKLFSQYEYLDASKIAKFLRLKSAIRPRLS